MTIQELLRQARKETGPDGDLLGVELLLAFVLDKDRGYLLAHGDEIVGEEMAGRFFELCGRLLAGEPVAYLLKKKEFYGLDFYVDRRVLIPRPETEHLVEWTLDHCKKDLKSFGSGGGMPRILDVGTGSGCIAVVLAKHLPSAHVTAVDISKDALDVARLNAERHGVEQRIVFATSNLMAAAEGPFDIVIANLPYIGESRFSFVSKSARDFEPHVALFGGDDGLALYRLLFEQLSRRPWRPRVLLGEFGFLQRDELESMLRKFFPDLGITFEQDYAHIDRMFVVKWPSYV